MKKFVIMVLMLAFSSEYVTAVIDRQQKDGSKFDRIAVVNGTKGDLKVTGYYDNKNYITFINDNPKTVFKGEKMRIETENHEITIQSGDKVLLPVAVGKRDFSELQSITVEFVPQQPQQKPLNISLDAAVTQMYAVQKGTNTAKGLEYVVTSPSSGKLIGTGKIVDKVHFAVGYTSVSDKWNRE